MCGFSVLFLNIQCASSLDPPIGQQLSLAWVGGLGPVSFSYHFCTVWPLLLAAVAVVMKPSLFCVYAGKAIPGGLEYVYVL